MTSKCRERIQTGDRCVVYCYHCIPTGKKYIGCTKNCRRWAQHKQSSKVCDTNFYRAVRTYGWDSFVFGVIEYVEDIERRYDREEYYIEEYDTVNKGYNSKNSNMHRDKQRRSVLHRLSTYEIEYDTGKVELVKNIKQYCKERGYDSGGLYLVKTNKRKNHKGIVRVTKLS